MNSYTRPQISIIVVFSIAANILGRFFTDTFSLPLLLDSFGTIFTAYCLGPWCGIIVGVSVNVFHGLFDPTLFAMAVNSICISLMVGFLSKKGWMNSLLQTMSLSILVALACVVISCALDFVFWNGKIGTATLQVLNGALFFYIMEQCSVFMLSVKKALKTKPDAFFPTSKIFWA